MSYEIPKVDSPEKEETREALREFHIEKLRAPHLQAFFRFLRHTPHLWDQVIARYKHDSQFENIAHSMDSEDDFSEIADDRDRIKLLTPLWSAAATIPECRAYLELLLDEATCAESDELKERIRGESYEVAELVVGGGVHGAAYNAEFIYNSPSKSRITVDANRKLGGQFRQYGGPAFSLNTSNRPINTDIEEQLDNPNMNSFGPHAPLQLPDVSGKFYTTNDEIGLVAAINEYLSAKNLVGVTVNKVELESEATSEERKKYKVTLLDNQTGETYTIITERIIASVGLGDPEYGFLNMTETTEKICKARDGRVLTYEDFLSEIGDRTNPFPLDRFVGKKIIIIGGGNSGMTVAEYLSGLGPEYRGSTTSIGSPAEIIILGTKFEDAKGFNDGMVARYAQLAELIKKSQSLTSPESRVKIITPVSKMRALEIEDRQTDEEAKTKRSRIAVVCGKKEEDGKISGKEVIEADIIISTAGYDEAYYKIFESILASQDEDDDETADFLEDVIVPESAYPVARHLRGHPEIVFIGPAAQMPISPEDEVNAMKFNRPRNSVGLPTTIEDTICLAEHISKSLTGETNREENNEKILSDKIFLPELGLPGREGGESIETLQFQISEQAKTQKFSPEINYENLLELLVEAESKRYTASSEQKFDLKIEAHGESEFEIIPNVFIPNEYRQMLSRVFERQIIQAAIHKQLFNKIHHRRKINLSVRIPQI